MEELNLEQPKQDIISQGEVVSQQVQNGEEQNITIGSNENKSDAVDGRFGKFKDAESLLCAYNNLQSDYTKKCQSLSLLQKEMEDKRKEVSSQNFEQEKKEEIALSQEQKEQVLQDYIFANQNLKDKFLARYFDEINLPQSPKLIGSDRGSSCVFSPVEKPKTLEDAGKIVKNILNNKN